MTASDLVQSINERHTIARHIPARLSRRCTLPNSSTRIINIVEYWSSMAQKNKNSRSSVTPTQSTILEQGDIFFFYRPKVRSETVESIDDVRRFFVVLAPDSKNLFRLLLIGKKSLPEIRETEARSSERYWARVGGIFNDPAQLTKELLSKEFREGDMARPAGEGKYAIVDHNKHTELVYVLELPKEAGEAQKELGIEKEASCQ